MSEHWDNPPRDPDAMNQPQDLQALQHAAAPPQSTHVTCPNCGYNLTGVAIGGNCPECNLMIGRGTVQNPNQPTSGNAIAALVLGICSIALCFSYGLISLICGPLAIYFARQADKQIKTGQFSTSSAGMATAGRVTGIIGLCLGLLGVLVLLLIFGMPIIMMIIAALMSAA